MTQRPIDPQRYARLIRILGWILASALVIQGVAQVAMWAAGIEPGEFR